MLALGLLTRMTWSPDVDEAVNFFVCTLDVRLLCKVRSRKRGISLNRIDCLTMERAGGKMMLLVQVGKA